MLKKQFQFLTLVALSYISSLAASNPLPPGVPVNITNDASVSSPVSVAGTRDGFVAVWNSSGNIMTSSTRDGLIWSEPVLAGTDSSYYIAIVPAGSTFLIAWINTDVGYYTGEVTTAYSTDFGSTWSSPVSVGSATNSNPPVALTHNSSGFMTAWTSPDGMFNRNVSTSFSADGITWSTPIQASPTMFSLPYDEVALASNPSGFLLSWIYYDGSHYVTYTSFSNDNGASWGTPVENPQANDVASGTFATVYGSNNGFMLSWVDSFQNVYSSFSSDNGQTWSAKTLVTDELAVQCTALANTGSGYIITWIDTGGTGNASFSSNQGASWSAPVTVTAEGTVANEYFGTISASSASPSYMFTWISGDSNAVSSGLITPFSSSNPDHSSTFFPQISPNRPGKGLFAD